MMKFAIVYDKVLRCYKTCLLDDAEGCEILVQFDADGYDDALAKSNDYFKGTKIKPEEIRCKESIDNYKLKAAAASNVQQVIDDDARKAAMERQAQTNFDAQKRLAKEQREAQEQAEEMLRKPPY